MQVVGDQDREQHCYGFSIKLARYETSKLLFTVSKISKAFFLPQTGILKDAYIRFKLKL